MTDWLWLRGIRAHGRHGVLPHERHHSQPFQVDLEVELDLSDAGSADRLDATVDYAALVNRVVEVIQGPAVDLIETLAERIAGTVLGSSAQAAAAAGPVQAVTVTVHKPHAPIGLPVDDVGVTVRRERNRPFVVALGSNLGDRVRLLTGAVRQIAGIDGLTVREVSPLYETDPVGGPEQPVYLNAVLVGQTRLSALGLLRRLHQIEADSGRRREVRHGPRTLDLDLIQVGDPADGTDEPCVSPDLTLPHPRAGERAFVLRPWLDVEPWATLRDGGRVVAVADLWARSAGDVPDDASGGLPSGVRPGPPWWPTW